MNYLLKNFPGTIGVSIAAGIMLLYCIVAAQQSVQLTAITSGILGVTFGMGIGAVRAAYILRRN